MQGFFLSIKTLWYDELIQGRKTWRYRAKKRILLIFIRNYIKIILMLIILISYFLFF
ncbi:hypothetical protein Lalb_Chr11g0071801 [Lupinus albus]|uniref:Uncharacterized protein n=1 Tax=Lupinus albus TaxID=3870 RepID=A0A6A4PSB4_LUPAL|nr:hypothetical protein Lalb_Chr11g0071801 [Lupinus albus]